MRPNGAPRRPALSHFLVDMEEGRGYAVGDSDNTTYDAAKLAYRCYGPGSMTHPRYREPLSEYLSDDGGSHTR